MSFESLASRVSKSMGSVWAFAAATSFIIVWALTGPAFHFSDTWQLIVNTSTTIITFLMVFLIQNTQNRDARALHLKLDELIFSSKSASNKMIDIENLTSAEFDKLAEKFLKLKKSNETLIPLKNPQNSV